MYSIISVNSTLSVNSQIRMVRYVVLKLTLQLEEEPQKKNLLV